LNSASQNFQGAAVPAVNESPIPVEIARQIQDIVEGDAVVKRNDFLKLDRDTQKQAQTCLETDTCILKLSYKFSSEIHANGEVVEVANTKKTPSPSKRKYSSVENSGVSYRTTNGILTGGKKQGPLGQMNQAPMTGGSTITYVVKKGDTLMEIAFEKYADYLKWRKVYRENRSKIVKPKLMQIGTELEINNYTPIAIKRNGKPYTIKKSDTLKSISLRLYGDENKWQSIWENNPELIRNPEKIYEGFTLYYEDLTTDLDQNRYPADQGKTDE